METGRYVEVALEQGIDRVLDYAVPVSLMEEVKVGQRVRVPLGKFDRPVFGFVVAIKPATEHPKVKPIRALPDPRPLLTPGLMELARWISRYYQSPLGVVIDGMIPSAVKKGIGLEQVQLVRLAEAREVAQARFESMRARKQRAVLARLLQADPGASVEILRLAAESGTTVATVRKLAKTGLVTIVRQTDFTPGTAEPLAGPVSAGRGEIELNPEQQHAVDELISRLGAGFSMNLLRGVTGSGKTEVYLRVIREVVNRGRQAIVLVPEIALTPQTLRRFTERFERVAVLHSGLSAGHRHKFWRDVSSGTAQVVVGARSAVFAPLRSPGLIVVDEEHEAGYKQDTAPRYHGKDVAIQRAALERVPVILGSATPSMESWHRVTTAQRQLASGEETVGPGPSRYHLLELPRRVRDLAMPKVEIVDLAEDRRARKGVHLLSVRLEKMLQAVLQKKQQAILLLNRRGYSNFVHCPSCQHVMTCAYCDTTMTYHRSGGSAAMGARFDAAIHSGQLHCHYCLAVNAMPTSCPACGKRLSLFGMGTQRVEEELTRKFPGLRFARVDSDSMRGAGDYERTLDRFGRGELDVLLGTQMLAKGLDFPGVTLVGVINGDTALSLPDFRAAERTFQLLTQVAGRAGRGDQPGRVIVQTLLPNDPTIQLAVAQDFEAFAERELHSRREVGLPPFARMARIVLRHQDEMKLSALAARIAEPLAATAPGGMVIRGPMPCPIGRIAGYFRQQIVLMAPQSREVQAALSRLRESGLLADAAHVAVDVDPVSLL